MKICDFGLACQFPTEGKAQAARLVHPEYSYTPMTVLVTAF